MKKMEVFKKEYEYIKNIELKETGALCNVAPTVLDLMGIEKPQEMDCESLIK